MVVVKIQIEILMLKMVVAQRVYGTMFVQDRPLQDSDGNDIDEDLKWNNIYMVIEIYPNGYAEYTSV